MLEFIFQKDSPFLYPMKMNRCWHLAINPGRSPKSQSELCWKNPERRRQARRAQRRPRWLPVRSRSRERWRATPLLSWHRSSWCPHRCPTRRSSIPRSVSLHKPPPTEQFILRVTTHSLYAQILNLNLEIFRSKASLWVSSWSFSVRACGWKQTRGDEKWSSRTLEL